MRPSVVIVDPDPSSQHELTGQLQANFHCIVASSLREATYLLLKEPPTLLILDLDQADGDALELIRRMQAHPMFRQVLIACVTRRSSIKDKIAAFRAGADDYLVKPVVPGMNFCGRMLLLVRAGHIARAARFSA
jgi:DNA-binding response OmpR family regulator